MKNFKKLIATILTITLAFGCIGSMSTFASAYNGSVLRRTVGTGAGEYLDERQEFIAKFEKIVGYDKHIYNNGFISYNNWSFSKEETLQMLNEENKIEVADGGISIDWPSNFSVILLDTFKHILIKFGVFTKEEMSKFIDAGFIKYEGESMLFVSRGVFLIIGAYILHNMKLENFGDIFPDDVTFEEKLWFAEWLHKTVKSSFEGQIYGDLNNIRASAPGNIPL